MRKLTVAAMLVAVSAFAGCRKTGEGEYQVVTPDVNVSTDTSKI